MKPTTIAVDVATATLEIAVSNRAGRVTERHRLPRRRVLPFFRKQPTATVLLEACASAHHWARELQALGHNVVLLPPHAVRPYVTRNKTDQTDAKALLEAYRNEDIHPVPVKSPDQQAIAAIHRLRSSWMATRTARLNATRGFAKETRARDPHRSPSCDPSSARRARRRRVRRAEHAAASPRRRSRGDPTARRANPSRREDPGGPRRPSPRRRSAPDHPGSGAAHLDRLGRLRRGRPALPLCSSLRQLPRSHPRERSSGKTRLLGAISKRGDPYLRMLLIHGARAVLWRAREKNDPGRLRAWALAVEMKRGHNKAAVALANKLARIVWAVWRKDMPFQEVTVA